MKVKPMNLMKPFSERTRFIFVDRAINIFFNSKHPFTSNNFSASRKRNPIPGFLIN